MGDRQMELDDNDITGIVALLVRLIRVQDERNAAGETRDAADKKFKEANAQWQKIRGAFVAFGFDPSSKELWDEMKAQIGQDKFDLAFRVARRSAQTEEKTETQSAKEEEPEADEAVEETEEPEEFEADDTGSMRVKDLVLNELKGHRAEGRKASEIRASIEAVLGRELHAKTVGMTLYRMSREGVARRDGRTWFAVLETANPGGDTPGSLKSGN
jgi:hypothetical protein